MKNKVQLIFGLILGSIGALTGLAYILFPNFFIRNHWNFGLGDKGLLIVGIIILSLSLMSSLLNAILPKFRRFLNRHRKALAVIYILNWTITLILFISFVNTTGAIVQSIA